MKRYLTLEKSYTMFKQPTLYYSSMKKHPLRFDVPVTNEERIKKTIQLGEEILKNSKIGGFDMKIPCDLILDLLPMYQNNLCSKATETYITEHLTTCDKCKARTHRLIQIGAIFVKACPELAYMDLKELEKRLCEAMEKE